MLLKVVAACYALLRVVLSIGLLRHRETRSTPNIAPFVSVVVAARNEARTLPALLDALLAQTYEQYEVIVVNDRSIDATPQVLEAYAARCDRLRVVTIDHAPPDRSPKMHALGCGVRVARGEVLLFTDADCRVPCTWIEGMAACFTPGVGAVLGYVDLHAPGGTLFEQVQAFDYFAMMAMLAGATKLGYPLGASGANLAYRRAAYDQAGGFDQMPPGAVADDMLLVQRVIDRTPYRIVFCDDQRTFVWTHAEPCVQQFLAQRVRWMRGGGEVLRHNRALLLSSSLIGMFNGILLCFPLLLLRRDLRRGLIYAVIGRLISEALHFGIAAKRFRRWDLLPYLPLWSVSQLPYSIVLPLLGLRGKVAWGDRQR